MIAPHRRVSTRPVKVRTSQSPLPGRPDLRPPAAPAAGRTIGGNTVSQPAKLTIRVRSSRGASTVQYSTGGKYRSLAVNDITNNLQNEPLFTTSGSKAFWAAVQAIVAADIAAGNGGGT